MSARLWHAWTPLRRGAHLKGVIDILIMRKIFIFLFFLFPSPSYSEHSGLEARLTSFVDEYRVKYYDKTVDLDELFQSYSSDIYEEHLKKTSNGNRFTSLYVGWMLNSPVEIENIENIFLSNCFDLDQFENCLVIEGEDTSNQKNPTIAVTLGFLKENREWKIGGVLIRRKSGSEFRYVSPLVSNQ